MDFWDLFINEEQIANAAALQVLQDCFSPEERKINYHLAVYTDFVDLDEIDRDEFIAATALLSNKKVFNKELSPAAIVLLYKFYSMISEDFEDGAKQIYRLFGIKSIRLDSDELLADNFNHALEVYSNFADTSYLEELNFGEPSGKMLVVYRNKIIILYLKEEEYYNE